MKNEQEHYLEKLSKSIITESQLDLPGEAFTSSVMAQVEALNTNKIVYQPLLSKGKLLFGLIVFLLLPAGLILGFNIEASSVVKSIDFSTLYAKTALLFSGIHIPSSFTYGILFLGLMFGIQVLLLKHRFNKRFEV